MAALHIPIVTDDNRTFYDMPEQSVCNGCAACCRTFRVSFYQGELDAFPLGTVPEAMTEPVTPHLVCMRGTAQGNGRCVALGTDLRCTIYAQRPSTCREYPAYLPNGALNPRCVALRDRLGIDPMKEKLTET